MLELLVEISTFSFDRSELFSSVGISVFFHQQCEIHATFGTIRISFSFSNLISVWGNSMHFQLWLPEVESFLKITGPFYFLFDELCHLSIFLLHCSIVFLLMYFDECVSTVTSAANISYLLDCLLPSLCELKLFIK